MIIKPSMTSLLNKVPSKYSLVVGTAKRAPAKMQVLFLVTVDNNDTVLYGCIMVALELQP